MIDPRILSLVAEIRDDYARLSALNVRYNDVGTAEARHIAKGARGKPDAAFPELDHFNDVFDRRAAMQKAMLSPVIRARRKTAAFICWVPVMLIIWQILASGGSVGSTVVATFAMGGVILFIDMRALFYRDLLRRNLREQLIEQGVRVCQPCGYDLRASASPRCPECGAWIPREWRSGPQADGSLAAPVTVSANRK